MSQYKMYFESIIAANMKIWYIICEYIYIYGQILIGKYIQLLEYDNCIWRRNRRRLLIFGDECGGILCNPLSILLHDINLSQFWLTWQAFELISNFSRIAGWKRRRKTCLIMAVSQQENQHRDFSLL